MQLASEEIKAAMAAHEGKTYITFKHRFTTKHLQEALGTKAQTLWSTEDPLVYRIDAEKRKLDTDENEEQFKQAIIEKLRQHGWSMIGEFEEFNVAPYRYSPGYEYGGIFSAQAPGRPSKDRYRVFGGTDTNESKGILEDIRVFKLKDVEGLLRRIRAKMGPGMPRVLGPVDVSTDRAPYFVVRPEPNVLYLEEYYESLFRQIKNNEFLSEEDLEMFRSVSHQIRVHPGDWGKSLTFYFERINKWLKGRASEQFKKEQKRLMDICQKVGENAAKFDLQNRSESQNSGTILYYTGERGGYGLAYDEQTTSLIWVHYTQVHTIQYETTKGKFWNSLILLEGRPTIFPEKGRSDSKLEELVLPVVTYLRCLAFYVQCISYLATLQHVQGKGKSEYYQRANRDFQFSFDSLREDNLFNRRHF